MGTDMVDTDAIDATADANLADTDMMDADAMDANVTDAMTDAMTDTHATDANLTDVDMMDADAMEDANTMDDDFTDTNTMDPDATASAIIVDQFPFGHPGAPIVGPHQASAPNRSSSTDSEWSPFRSRIDWEVAWWAKTCGITLSAVRELLAIPGVSPSLIRLDAGLIYRPRLLMHSDFHTELQNN